MRLWWLIAALLLSGALLALHYVAMEEFLYWRYAWFDIPMHFLGGLSLGVLGVGLLHRRRPAALALFVAAAFVAWEIFEVVFGLPLESNYVSDTALDIVMDSAGALLAYLAARMTIWKA
jgi:hypothetical protein